MNPERLRQLDELYARASRYEGIRRSEFLREACAGDEALQSEVESLFAEEEAAKPFLEEGALQAAAKELAHDGT